MSKIEILIVKKREENIVLKEVDYRDKEKKGIEEKEGGWKEISEK